MTEAAVMLTLYYPYMNCEKQGKEEYVVTSYCPMRTIHCDQH